MAQIEYATSSYKSPLHHRILANMPVKASWIDEESGKRVNVLGTTENIGENSALVNLETLPPVGSEVKLRILDEEKTLIEVQTKVIRVVSGAIVPPASGWQCEPTLTAGRPPFGRTDSRHFTRS